MRETSAGHELWCKVGRIRRCHFVPVDVTDMKLELDLVSNSLPSPVDDVGRTYVVKVLTLALDLGCNQLLLRGIMD